MPYFSENVAWIDVQEKINEMVTESVGAAPEKPAEAQALAPVGETGLIPVNLKQYEVQLVDLQSAVSYMLYKVIFKAKNGGKVMNKLKNWDFR